jgi:sigma-B regulation protein RsbU (phosphoserine phosphatase)
MTDVMIDNAPLYYFSFTDDGKITGSNALLRASLGYTAEELQGKHVEQLFTISGRIFYHTHLFPLLRLHGFANEIFMTLQTSTKESVPVLINAKKDPGDTVVQYNCAGIGVPNRKKFEDELVAARKQAESALNENTALLKVKEDLEKRTGQLDVSLHKLIVQHNELMQFSKVITHDLQEPVRKISLFLGMIEQAGSQLPENVARLIGKISTSAERLRFIVTGLQQFLWLTEHRVEITSTDLNAVLQEAVAELKKTFVPVVWEIECQSLPVIDCESGQLVQLFYMLLENSVKYRKPGERVRISITSTILAQNAFRSTQDKYRYEDCVRIRFSDDGTGFDPAYNEYVFSLFSKLHDGSGMGLGLALCRMIAEHHNGYLKGEGIVGAGAVFTLVLPLKHDLARNHAPGSGV